MRHPSFYRSLWFSLSGLAAVIGNGVMLWLFYKSESLRTISNRFLASLCVADFFVGLVIDPTWIAIRCLIQPPKTHILMRVVDILWIHTTAATVFNLCCASVDRFISTDSLPFSLSGHYNQEKMLLSDYNGVVYRIISAFHQDSGR